WVKGPRSLIRTITILPVFRQVTRTTVPKGRLRCAAVKMAGSKASPLAVRFCSFGRYQEAGPVWEKTGFSALAVTGTRGKGGRAAVVGGVAVGGRPGAQAPAQRASAITAGCPRARLAGTAWQTKDMNDPRTVRAAG